VQIANEAAKDRTPHLLLVLAGEEGGRGQDLAHLFLDDAWFVVVHVDGARALLPDHHRHLASAGQLVRPQAVEQALGTLLRPGKVGGEDLGKVVGGLVRVSRAWGLRMPD